MRMRELVEATGLPRTAIHHYQREGLLPPGKKTAANAAVYGEEHVARLRLIQALRTDEMGPFPLERVRAVLALVDAGVEPEVATALHSLPGTLRPPGDTIGSTRMLAVSDLAREAGLSLVAARQLVDAGLILGVEGKGGARVFDGADLGVARLMAEFLEATEIRVDDLEPIAELVSETERYERALIDLATSRLDADAAAERRHTMSRSLNALHTYLYLRAVPDAAAS